MENNGQARNNEQNSGITSAIPTLPNTKKVELTKTPINPWVFRTYSMGGWDYSCNPLMVMVSVEMVQDEQNGGLAQSNVILDIVEPNQPSRRVCVMTESLLEVAEEIKAQYTMERLASQGKKRK